MTTATPSAGSRRRGRRDTAGLPPVSAGRLAAVSAACTAAAALLQLDGTLITVALPSVAHGLGVKGSSTSVVLSAYFGAYALVLIPGGELVDRFGVRRLALAGLAVFAVGAAAGALVSEFRRADRLPHRAGRGRRTGQPCCAGRGGQRFPA